MFFPCRSDSMYPRHEGHHHHHSSNAKYANTVFVVSMVSLVAIGVINYLRALLVALKIAKVRVPLALQVSSWALFTITVSLIPLVWAQEITNELWTDVARRLGRVGYALVPFTVYLAIRPSPLPRTLYLLLIPLHKWISRLMIVLTTVHGFGFLYKWGFKDVYAKALKFANFTGISATAMLVLVSIISLKPLRKISYLLFYSGHTVTAWAMLFLITAHARPSAHYYTLLTALLMAYSVACKIAFTHRTKLVVESLPDSSLSLVKIPRTAVSGEVPAGSHVRLSAPLSNYRSWLYATHPYTVAQYTEENVALVVRKSRFHINNRDDFAVSQAFKSVRGDFFTQARKAVIVCGGSGISFGLPILQFFINKRKTQLEAEDGIGSGIEASLVWCIREKADVFILERLGIMEGDKLVGDFAGLIQVYFTGKKPLQPKTPETLGIKQFFSTVVAKITGKDIGGIGVKSPGYTEVAGYEEGAPHSIGEAMEMEELEDEFEISDTEESTKVEGIIHSGRPDLEEVLEPLLASSSPDFMEEPNRWVVSCGPESLIRDCQSWCKRHKAQHLFEEYVM